LPALSGKRGFLDLLRQEGVEIVFGNPRHKTYTRTAEEVNIIGRVVWYARKL
jgi:hypothetical protein